MFRGSVLVNTERKQKTEQFYSVAVNSNTCNEPMSYFNSSCVKMREGERRREFRTKLTCKCKLSNSQSSHYFNLDFYIASLKLG